MADLSLKFLLFGEDRGASKAIKGVGAQAGDTSKKMAIGVAAAGTAAVAFAKVSVDKFQQVTSQTMGLQRVMGGTAEEASRLRFGAQQSGVGFDVLSASMRVMSKHSGVGDKAMKAIGVSFRDASGKIRPTGAVINDLADKFKKMPNGPAKSALAMKVFGKAGVGMLPMMSKGSAGLKALAKDSDKFGNTISGKDTAAVKENTKQKRLMNAAMDGLQIMLGRILMPIVLKVTTTLASLAAWFNQNIKVLGPLVAIIGTLVAIVVIVNKAIKAWAAIQVVLNLVLSANPIGLIIIAVALLIGGIVLIATKTTWFQTIWKGMTTAIGIAWRWVWNNILAPVIRLVLHGFANVATMIGKVLSALGRIPGFGWARSAGDALQRAGAKARELASGIRNIPSHRSVRVDLSIRALAANMTQALSHNIGIRAVRAAGGPVASGSAYLVGEKGPELFVPDGAGKIVANDRLGGARGSALGGGSEIHIYVNGQVYGSTTELASAVLTGMQRLKGRGVKLGLA